MNSCHPRTRRCSPESARLPRRVAGWAPARIQWRGRSRPLAGCATAQPRSVPVREQSQNDEFPAAQQGVQTQAGLSQARLLLPLVLYHYVWWGAAFDPETVHRATTRPRLGALHLQPSARRALPGALGAKGGRGRSRVGLAAAVGNRRAPSFATSGRCNVETAFADSRVSTNTFAPFGMRTRLA
jgi:hypothetical protein